MRIAGIGVAVLVLSLLGPAGMCPDLQGRSPNFIIIFADDQGYNDLGCFGSPNIKTPNIDRLAAEGMRFTDFYSGASVCTPSRAALLTGCYPERVGNLPVLFPNSDRGLNPDETTIAEMLRASGYATACFGKWHLGHHKPFLPTSQGFDEYFGVPYSNDMGSDTDMELADKVEWREGLSRETFRAGLSIGPPLFRGTQVIECPADQTTLTKRYTAEAIRFVTKHSEAPFFLYMPQTMPHIPLYASDKFAGTSDAGLYGDTLEEIDWSVGQIVDTLKKLKIDRHTMVVYTSDNGPWNLKGSDEAKVKGNTNRRVGGSAYPLRGFKFQKWEGGMREPCVMWWPGRIPAGTVCREIAATIDLLPTLAELANATVPNDRVIDGRTLVPLIEGREGATTPHESYFYRTVAVRAGKWKLMKDQLFDLAADVSESNDVASRNPEVVQRLRALLASHRADMKANARSSGQFERPLKKLAGLPGWQIGKGLWTVDDDAIKQSVTAVEAAAFSPPIPRGNYTLEVEARVIEGREGFRVMVRAQDARNYVRWSLGAFGNTKHSLMTVAKGRVAQRGKTDLGSIESGRWYRLKVLASGTSVRCYLDGDLVNELDIADVAENSGVGLGSNQASVEFRNLRITSNERDVLFDLPQP